MDYGAEFTACLPQLRRHARALTGSQEAGDQLVVFALERLQRNLPRDASDPKLIIFQTLSLVWNGLIGDHVLTELEIETTDSEVDKRLSAMGRRSRQAFLLSALDEFSDDDAATILQLSVATFSKLLIEARSEIAALVSTNVLIIEDEYFISANLERAMTDLGHNVSGVARTHKEAIEQIANNLPGLILADIQLADGSNGIDAVNEILPGHPVPVVFITAYPERLLTGLRPEPTYLLTKPVKMEALRAVVSQALFFQTAAKAGTDDGFAVRALVSGIQTDGNV